MFLQRDSDVRIWLCRECFSVWIDDAVIVSSNPTCTCRNEDTIGEGGIEKPPCQDDFA